MTSFQIALLCQSSYAKMLEMVSKLFYSIFCGLILNSFEVIEGVLWRPPIPFS